MTVVPDQALRWRGKDVARWSLCALTVLAIHGAAAGYMAMHAPGAPPAGVPDIIPMEMPEIATAPSEAAETPPGPEMPVTEDLPEKLAEKPDEEEAVPEEVVKPVEPEPEVPPAPLAPKPEVAVEPQEPEPPKKEEVKPVEKKPELPKRPERKQKRVEKQKPRTTPPRAAQAAQTTNAPMAVAPPVPSNAMPAWNGMIGAMLQRNLRYPQEADRRGVKGVASIRIVVGASGQLMSVSLVRSAGDSSLDQEAVAVARRTAPFPPPPGGAATRVIPIRFE